jgi:WD40 repeat protein
LVDATTGRIVQSLTPRHAERVGAVAFSPDSATFLTASTDKTIRLWETATRRPLGPPLDHEATHFGFFAAAFSPDGRAVASGGEDETARLWDVAGCRPIGTPLQHQGKVWSVAFSPDGRTLLTGSVDGTARLWDAATGRPIGTPLAHQGRVRAAVFSPDGKKIATACGDHTARLWQLPEPVDGDLERVTLWVQVIAGMELDPQGTFHVLDGATWQQRQQRLHQLGGPPVP